MCNSFIPLAHYTRGSFIQFSSLFDEAKWNEVTLTILYIDQIEIASTMYKKKKEYECINEWIKYQPALPDILQMLNFQVLNPSKW